MNQGYKSYLKWLKNVKDKEILKELQDIENNFEEIEDRFSQEIEFGTAGIRGIMQCGTNRINVHVVRKVTQGLADYLNSKSKTPSVSISFDSRNKSEFFARETAAVLAANGIKVFITKELSPTPFLSYCVRTLHNDAGIMITASHNTAEYNGYKCYGPDGAQMDEIFANKVYDYIKKVDMFDDVKYIDFSLAKEKGFIEFVNEDIYKNYIEKVLEQRVNNNSLKNLNIVYTPLNGTGNAFIKDVFSRCDAKSFSVVKSQEMPDGNFTTCHYPNPELKNAFVEALKVANEHSSDIILATDPDADRLGVCVKHDGDYQILTGNQIGILLLEYILKTKFEKGILPDGAVVVKSMVSSCGADVIAANYGCTVKNVFTGFKNIAKEILNLEKSNELKKYVFGFEESNGYLAGTYVRDKDAVSAAMLVAETAAYYKEKFNMTLIDMLNGIYLKYGFFGDKTLPFSFSGYSAKKKIENIMQVFRDSNLKNIKNHKILKTIDYLNNSNNVKSNMIEIIFEDGSKVIVRPSGTEPKIKIYFMVNAKSKEQRDKTLNDLVFDIEEFVNKI